MTNRPTPDRAADDRRLVANLARLLAIDVSTLRSTVQEGSDLLAQTLHADKTDVFLYERATDSLVALGTSHTSMGERQHALGLQRQPLSAGGSAVWVFTTGQPSHQGHADQDPWELRGVVEGLGVRSQIGVPLVVGGASRGVLQAYSAQPERFTEDDLQFLTAVASWLGLIAQQEEWSEQVSGTHPLSGVPLTPAQAQALSEHELQMVLGSLDAQAADPDEGWKAHLVRWKLRQMETQARETQATLAVLQATFVQSQHQLGTLHAGLDAAQEQIRNLEQEAGGLREAARERHAVEEKLTRAEAQLAHLQAQEGIMSEERCPPAGKGADASTEVRLLTMLERLLTIPATAVGEALNEAAQAIAEVLDTEKVDAFLYDPSSATLVAVGVSATPLGQQQRQIGLDRLPVAHGGRTVEVFQTGTTYRTGHADDDPGELRAVTADLGIRSIIAAPLQVNGERRGVLQIDAQQANRYTDEDQHFVEAVALWVGMVAHQAELAERLARETAEQARWVAADELITVLAHDLRNHLTPLKGRLDLLHTQAQREGHARYTQDLAVALGALGRINGLVTDLLDVSRLDQGLFALAVQPVDLVSMAQQIADVLRGPTVSIVVRAPEEVIVQADPQRLRQALENVLSNALRHAPAGTSVSVEVGTEGRAEGAWAVLSVHDEGPGIPPTLLPRLFERFSAGPGSPGLGLGLYLTRAILEAHGGGVTVASAPASGATFVLAVPLLPRCRSDTHAAG